MIKPVDYLAILKGPAQIDDSCTLIHRYLHEGSGSAHAYSTPRQPIRIYWRPSNS